MDALKLPLFLMIFRGGEDFHRLRSEKRQQYRREYAVKT